MSENPTPRFYDRISGLSMATTLPDEKDSVLERTYKWMHQHFPHIFDCQPIPAETLIADAGFELTKTERLNIFKMPVAAIAATRG